MLKSAFAPNGNDTSYSHAVSERDLFINQNIAELVTKISDLIAKECRIPPGTKVTGTFENCDSLANLINAACAPDLFHRRLSAYVVMA